MMLPTSTLDLPDIVNWGPVVWAATWAVALIFTAWNARDNYRGLMETIGDPDSTPAVLASAWWFFRMDVIKGVACSFMVVGGLFGMFGASPDFVRGSIVIASIFMAINQIWNRTDRMRVVWFIRRARAREEASKGELD